VNRSSILCSSVPVVGALLLLVACGPRMKPVDYQEPTKDLSASGEGGGDDDSAPKSSDSSSSSETSASSATPSSSSEGGGGASKFSGACKDKKCGETCTECAPGDEACMEVLVLKQCNPKGDCIPAPARIRTKTRTRRSRQSSVLTRFYLC